MKKKFNNSFFKIIYLITIIGFLFFSTTSYAITFNPIIGDDDEYEKIVPIE